MPDITLIPVESARVQRIGYDAASRTLAVEFPRGAQYHYADVPPEVYAEFLDAASKGKFFEASIRGKYAYEKQEPAKADAEQQ